MRCFRWLGTATTRAWYSFPSGQAFPWRGWTEWSFWKVRVIYYSNVMYSGGPYTSVLITTFDAPGILVWANCNLSLSPHFRNLNEGHLKTWGCQESSDSPKSLTLHEGIFLRLVEVYPQSFRPFETTGYFQCVLEAPSCTQTQLIVGPILQCGEFFSVPHKNKKKEKKKTLISFVNYMIIIKHLLSLKGLRPSFKFLMPLVNLVCKVCLPNLWDCPAVPGVFNISKEYLSNRVISPSVVWKVLSFCKGPMQTRCLTKLLLLPGCCKSSLTSRSTTASTIETCSLSSDSVSFSALWSM